MKYRIRTFAYVFEIALYPISPIFYDKAISIWTQPKRDSQVFCDSSCWFFPFARLIFSEGASEEYLHEIANWPMPVEGWPANCKELAVLRPGVPFFCASESSQISRAGERANQPALSKICAVRTTCRYTAHVEDWYNLHIGNKNVSCELIWYQIYFHLLNFHKF